jgi:hypothetical protein
MPWIVIGLIAAFLIGTLVSTEWLIFRRGPEVARLRSEALFPAHPFLPKQPGSTEPRV